MRIFKDTPQWNIMGKKRAAFIVSLILLSAGLIGLLVKGLTYGIDFRGGTLIQLKFQERPPLTEIRTLLQKELDSNVNITTFGAEEDNEVIVTLSKESLKGKIENLSDFLKSSLGSELSFKVRRIETVGPKVGAQLKEKAFYAAIYVMAGILIYIGFRFKVRYGIAAVLALFHDVLITLGFFVFLEKEFTLAIVAAVLTIIGYSLNDTIVVFDRIRENMAARSRKEPVEQIINKSINESLSRTILTSVTTFLVVFSLFVLGGDIIHDFCFAMLIGLVVGTYSSIFVASPAVLFMDPDRLKALKEARKAKA